jgi:hypothetical protein
MNARENDAELMDGKEHCVPSLQLAPHSQDIADEMKKSARILFRSRKGPPAPPASPPGSHGDLPPSCFA